MQPFAEAEERQHRIVRRRDGPEIDEAIFPRRDLGRHPLVAQAGKQLVGSLDVHRPGLDSGNNHGLFWCHDERSLLNAVERSSDGSGNRAGILPA
jgi:hypothetical protein